MPANGDRAAAGIDDAADNGDERRLTRAIGTEQAKYLTLVNIQLQVLNNRSGAKMLRELMDIEHGCVIRYGMLLANHSG